MNSDTIPEIRYRRATPADWNAIVRVLRFVNFHNVPSPEMPHFDLDGATVAEGNGQIVGVAGWTQLDATHAKTTLMAVDPAWRRFGIGARLQENRMREMIATGCHTVVTNADLPETIAWYKRKFGYHEIGTLPKVHEFGDPHVDHWTTLESDLRSWERSMLDAGAAGDSSTPSEQTGT